MGARGPNASKTLIARKALWKEGNSSEIRHSGLAASVATQYEKQDSWNEAVYRLKQVIASKFVKKSHIIDAEEKLKWLQEHPNNWPGTILGWAKRKLLFAKICEREGKDPETQGSEVYDEKPRRPKDIKSARILLKIQAARKRKKGQPTWMQDPKLLPKSPPGGLSINKKKDSGDT